jgi:hypothetical protein
MAWPAGTQEAMLRPWIVPTAGQCSRTRCSLFSPLVLEASRLPCWSLGGMQLSACTYAHHSALFPWRHPRRPSPSPSRGIVQLLKHTSSIGRLCRLHCRGRSPFTTAGRALIESQPGALTPPSLPFTHATAQASLHSI